MEQVSKVAKLFQGERKVMRRGLQHNILGVYGTLPLGRDAVVYVNEVFTGWVLVVYVKQWNMQPDQAQFEIFYRLNLINTPEAYNNASC